MTKLQLLHNDVVVGDVIDVTLDGHWSYTAPPESLAIMRWLVDQDEDLSESQLRSLDGWVLQGEDRTPLDAPPALHDDGTIAWR